jgi:hypothetical protein
MRSIMPLIRICMRSKLQIPLCRVQHLYKSVSFIRKSYSTGNVTIKEEVAKSRPELRDKLVEFGIGREEVERMMERWPELTRQDVNRLEGVLEAWQQCQFGEENQVRLLATHPNLLSLSPTQVENTIVKLSSRFNNKYVYKIVYNAPDVMFEDWDMFEDKLDYLLNTVRASKTEIVNSGALGHPLPHLKQRLTFLCRAGAYTIPKPKTLPQEMPRNPKLDVIVNSSDKYLATKVAGLTLFEYEVFQQLYSTVEGD